MLKYLGNFQKADKGSYVVVWDKSDYKSQADKQLSDTDANENFKFNEKILQNLLEERNIFLKKTKYKGIVTEKDPNYFTYKYKKARDAAKIYCLKYI